MSKCPRFVFLIIAVLFIPACAAPAGQQGSPAVTNVEQPEALSEEVITPAGEIAVEPVPESLPSHTPGDLIGLEPKEIQGLLGPVSLKRWEGEAQVMQFKGDQCVMDIYFYEAAPGGAFEATYLSARTLNGADVDTASCLTSLLPE